MKKYKVICMSLDGEYKEQSPRFETIEETSKYANDLGPKWYSYPFDLICTEKTVVSAGYGLYHLEGKRIKTIAKYFKEVSERPEMQGCNAEEFYFAL